MDGAAFEDLVREALDELPPWIQQRLDNVDVLIEDTPPRGRRNLLGLYEGVPLTHRGANYFGVLPDRITLFRSTIERVARSGGDVKGVVRRTVVHEFAHFFGISDERLREIDRY